MMFERKRVEEAVKYWSTEPYMKDSILLEIAQALLDGKLCEVDEEKVNGIADGCMYAFPKTYSNAQIISYQKGIDVMWVAVKALLGRIPKFNTKENIKVKCPACGVDITTGLDNIIG